MPVKPVDKNSKNDTEKSEEKKEPEKKPSGGTKEPDKGLRRNLAEEHLAHLHRPQARSPDLLLGHHFSGMN
jgi:hypothetical protein